MSYYLAKRSQIAKQYLADREAQDKIKPPSERLMRSRVWLDQYMARPRQSSMNWAQRWPLKPPGEQIIEGEFTELVEEQQ